MAGNLFSHVGAYEVTTGVAQSAGSTDHYTSWVDCRGYEGVAFVTHLSMSTGACAGTYHLEMAATSTPTAGTDIYGTSGTLSTALVNDTALVITETHRPLQRYVRLYLTRSTGESIISCVALRYRARTAPVSADLTTDHVANLTIGPGYSTA